MYEKMDKGEVKVVREIVKRAIARGYELIVFDGEESFSKSCNEKTIINNMMNTDEDLLSVYSPDGVYIGSIMFVYGNSAEEVICDHNDNELIRTLVAGL